MRIIEMLSRQIIVPVIKLNDVNKAIPMAQALIDGGINCAEITYRTDNAGAIIKSIKEYFGERFIVGAGTVLSTKTVDNAIENGADFLVSPGTNGMVIEHCIAKNAVIIPGVATCTEIENAMQYNLTHLKFFPAEACGGTAFLKAVQGPYPMIKFMPTGGISMNNFADYTALKNVFVCGGSFVVTDSMLANDDYATITKTAKSLIF